MMSFPSYDVEVCVYKSKVIQGCAGPDQTCHKNKQRTLLGVVGCEVRRETERQRQRQRERQR